MENNQLNSPKVFCNKEHDKDSEFQDTNKINPVSENLNTENKTIDIETFIDGGISEILATVNSQVANLTPQKISEGVFAVGIWKFQYSQREKNWYLKGLYFDGFIKLLTSLGFYKRYRNDQQTYVLIREVGSVITEIEIPHIKDAIFSPNNLQFNDLRFTYETKSFEITKNTLREIYLQQFNNVININFLTHLETHKKPILQDSREQTHLFFRNGILSINRDGFNLKPFYKLTTHCVWREHILSKPFESNSDFENSHYSQFIKNVTNGEPERFKAFCSAIGYLINNYSDPAKGRAVICYDEEITDLKNPEGGTGKGVFANGLKLLRNVIKLDGKKFDPSDRFRFQAVGSHAQIVWIDDAPRKFGFDVFHSVLTDGWNVEAKNKPEIFIKPQDSPKLLLTSNSVVDGGGNTNERRQFIIEFAPYYKDLQKNGYTEPLRHEHGCTFFDDNDWNTSDWNKFYAFMVSCVKFYHKNGLSFYKPKNVDRNKLLQTTSTDFAQWITEKDIELNQWHNTSELFNEFKETTGDPDLKQRKFTEMIKQYATIFGYQYDNKQVNSISHFILSKISV